MFWGTRATSFSIYTPKMEGAGPTILGTGTKFKRVPCQKNCRVNRALIAKVLSWAVLRSTQIARGADFIQKISCTWVQ